LSVRLTPNSTQGSPQLEPMSFSIFAHPLGFEIVFSL
jgi:hypothetical protein